MRPQARSAFDPHQLRPVTGGFPLNGAATLERQHLGQRVLGQRHRHRLPPLPQTDPGPLGADNEVRERIASFHRPVTGVMPGRAIKDETGAHRHKYPPSPERPKTAVTVTYTY